MAETTPDAEKWQAVKQENAESDEQIPEQKITIQTESQAPKQRKKTARRNQNSNEKSPNSQKQQTKHLNSKQYT